MAESTENQFIAAFTSAWGELAQSLLGCDSGINLTEVSEIAPTELQATLATVQEFASAFITECAGELNGTLIVLFKAIDRIEIEELVKATDISKQEGCGSLLNAILAAVADKVQDETGTSQNFNPIRFIDFSTAENSEITHLATILTEPIQFNALALAVGNALQSEIKILFAPQEAAAVFEPAAAQAAAAGNASFPAADRNLNNFDDPSRNIERLLAVELEVIVRFGKTQMALRELVRIGVGSMIELNRQVDEPVELLVNNHSLARGTVVVVDGYYGVRITEIGKPEERRLSLSKA